MVEGWGGSVPQNSPSISQSRSLGGAASMSPLKSARAHCVDCCGGDAREVTVCTAASCPLHVVRLGARLGGDPEADRTLVDPKERQATRAELAGASTIGLIRRRCIDCSGGSLEGVRNCTFASCALHPFRMGKNPNRAGIGFGRGENERQAAKNAHSRPEFLPPQADLVLSQLPLPKSGVSGSFPATRPSS